MSDDQLAPSTGVRTFCRRLAAMELVGAAACARELCNVLSREYEASDPSDPSTALAMTNDLAHLARQVDETKPATSLYRLVLSSLHAATEAGRAPTAPSGPGAQAVLSVLALLASARAISSWLARSTIAVGEQCLSVLGDSEAIFVYDYSSTVLEAVKSTGTKRG